MLNISRRSSESHPGQAELFNELEECLDDSPDEAHEQETISYTRKKRTGR